ncbi:hypothetical protein HK096_002668, partial [Nowakowskiella sp. JEL0078]
MQPQASIDKDSRIDPLPTSIPSQIPQSSPFRDTYTPVCDSLNLPPSPKPNQPANSKIVFATQKNRAGYYDGGKYEKTPELKSKASLTMIPPQTLSLPQTYIPLAPIPSKFYWGDNYP